MRQILCYKDFVEALLEAGFSMGGSNQEGVYSIIPWNWDEEAPYPTPVRWHTGDAEHDPWVWRMRLLTERRDVAYAKLFFKKSGFITRAWYPHFLAARRGGTSLEGAYQDGTISHMAKRIYGAVAAHDSLPLHSIKQEIGFQREDKAVFDRSLVELQMKMYLTMCGEAQKTRMTGEGYGWSSTVFCTTERFFGEEVVRQAEALTKEHASQAIAAQLRKLSPDATDKRIHQFIFG